MKGWVCGGEADWVQGSPKYDNNFCKAGVEETRVKAEVARGVPVPGWDVVNGVDGPLCGIWREAANRRE